MSLRRYLNLVVQNRKNGIFSLRRINLSRQHLFYPSTPPSDAAAEQKNFNLQEMESIRIPAPSVRFQPNPIPNTMGHNVHFFGLSESKIICTDSSGLSFLYDAGLHSFVTMPSLHTAKCLPISFSVPDPEQDAGGGSLYIMERVPEPRPAEGQFEAFLYAASEMSYTKSWQRHSLPPPPYVLDPGYKRTRIDSHAVLGGGSHLCVSSQGIGTYCFDTASREWSRAGDWMLPFYGRAEYVPELNLWFGLSERDFLPCTADLSSVLKGRKPMLRNVWRYPYPPEWNSLLMTEVVSLGSGRFCIFNFFQTILEDTYSCYGEPVVDQTFGVYTGVELMASRGDGDKLNGNGSGVKGNMNGSGANGNGNGNCKGKGKRSIRMINHMSKLHNPAGYTIIQAVL